MIKKLLTAILSTIAITAQAQDELVITAKMDWLPNDSAVILYEPYVTEVDTVYIKNHSFSITKKMPKGGSVHILQVGNNANSDYDAVVLYLDAGKLNISSGKQPGFKHAKYTGSSFVNDWNYVMNNFSETSKRYERVNELEKIFLAANRIGDEDAAEAANKEAGLLIKKRNEDALAWMRKNPNSGVAAYIVMAWFPQNQKDSLLRTLGEHAQNSRIAQRILNPGKVDPQLLTLRQGKDSRFEVGKEAPAFTTLDENGKQVSLADFKGKYVFINFWASWCGPCKPQIPYLKTVYDKYQSSENFVMIGISLDNNREPWLKAVKKYDLNWLQLSSLKSWQEPGATAFGIDAVPFNILIGPDGKMLTWGLYDGAIEKALEELIK